MAPCVELTAEMLISPLRVNAPGENLSFSTARRIADKAALEVSPDAMLLAWLDRKAGAFSPKVE